MSNDNLDLSSLQSMLAPTDPSSRRGRRIRAEKNFTKSLARHSGLARTEKNFTIRGRTARFTARFTQKSISETPTGSDNQPEVTGEQLSESASLVPLHLR